MIWSTSAFLSTTALPLPHNVVRFSNPAIKDQILRLAMDGSKKIPNMIARPLAETIRSFEELCEGKWDHLPEGAFMYVGAIEEAAEQAKKMAAG